MLNDELVYYTLKNGETIDRAYEINKDTLKCSWYQMSEENSSNIIYVEKDWLTIEEIKTETELNYRDILNFTLNVGDFLLYEDNGDGTNSLYGFTHNENLYGDGEQEPLAIFNETFNLDNYELKL